MRLKSFATMVAAALALTMGAYAQNGNNNSDPTSQNGSNMQLRTLSGQIAGFRQMDLVNDSGRNTHSLIRVRLQDGRKYVVDLGPNVDVDDIELEQGDQVQARGYFTRVGGRRVFVATQARVNGETYELQQPPRTVAGSQSMQGSTLTLNGTIQGFRHERVRGSQGEQQTHTLAKIELNSGRTCVVDLGPKQRLDNLDLQKGEQVQLQALRGTLDGQQMLLANRLSFPERHNKSDSAAARNSGQTVTLHGKVQGYQISSITEQGNQQVLLRLDLQNGHSVLINATDYEPGELDLKNLNLGDRVTIKAHRTQTDNGPQLIADNIDFQDATGSTGQSQTSTGSSESHKSGKNQNNSSDQQSKTNQKEQENQ